MRFLLFICIAIIGLSACNNDLTTIGQDLIYNGNKIEVNTITLTNVGTVKIDSFVTSSGKYGYANSELYMGRYTDEYSGTTTAYPYFQLVPSYQPNISSRYVLDSVTFHFSYGGKIWGDTLTARPQTYDLYQLKELPTLDTDNDEYFYNTDSVPRGRKLATTTFLPKVNPMKHAYFKLPIDNASETGRYMQDLFDKMKYDDLIFRPNPNSTITYYRFLDYFKGLTIRPAAGNDCLMSIKADPDSLYMRFYYHEEENQYSFDLRLLTQSPVYQFNQIHNAPSTTYGLEVLTDQEKEVPFTEHDFAIVQGLAGYMMKLIIPEPEIPIAFKTVVKAEIEMKPEVWYDPSVALPYKINAYYTNVRNEIKDIVYNTTNNPVTGNYIFDNVDIENTRYIFDITDYYQQLVSSSDSESKRQLLLTLPNLSSSFDRMMIKEAPKLRIYYATYKD